MSADEMHTQLQHDHTEMITQADILSRLVQMQDRLYHIEQMLHIVSAKLPAIGAGIWATRDVEERAKAQDDATPGSTPLKHEWPGDAGAFDHDS